MFILLCLGRVGKSEVYMLKNVGDSNVAVIGPLLRNVSLFVF